MKPYYDRDGITVYVGDCLEVLPTLDEVDHVITDPPYGLTTHEGARSMKDIDAPMVTFESIESDALGAILAQCKARRWMIATMEWRHVAKFDEMPPDGWEFVRHGIWVKPDGAPQFTGDRPATGWESVAIFHRPGRKRWNGGGHHAVWTYNVARGMHPTQKPLPLFKRFIEDFTDLGDIILDPFAGSLTTAVAANQLGRRCIAIEREQKYVDAGLERLRQGVLL